MTSLNEPALEKAQGIIEQAALDNFRLVGPATATSEAITAYLEAVGDGWEPIGDSHKDGEDWLLSDAPDGHITVGGWDETTSRWSCNEGLYEEEAFTKARPLPAPPQEGE